MIKTILIIILLLGTANATSCHQDIQTFTDDEYQILSFLTSDKTDEHIRTSVYSCSHVTADLRDNLTAAGINNYGILISNDRKFQGMGHAVTLVVIDDVPMVIESFTDDMTELENYCYKLDHQYLKFFHGSDDVPARFTGSYNADIIVRNYDVNDVLNCLN